LLKSDKFGKKADLSTGGKFLLAKEKKRDRPGNPKGGGGGWGGFSRRMGKGGGEVGRGFPTEGW